MATYKLLTLNNEKNMIIQVMTNKFWILIKFIILIWVSVLAIVKRVSNIRFTFNTNVG